MIKGRKVKIGSKDFILPPILLADLEIHEQDIDAVQQGAMGMKAFGVMRTVVLLALQRNYPEMTLDTLKPMLDAGNIGELFKAALAVGGLVEIDPGEATAAL